MEQIPKFDDYYADELGNIFSKRRKGNIHKMKPWEDRKGYLVVSVRNNKGAKKNMFVHRLVAMAYIPNPHNFPVVNHKDRNAKNNMPDNLEWCTIEYNNKYTFTTGKPMNGNRCRLYKDNICIGVFNSEKQAAIEANRLWGSSISTLRKAKQSKGVVIKTEINIYNKKYYLFDNNGLVNVFKKFSELSAFTKEKYHCNITKSKYFNKKNHLVYSEEENFNFNNFWKTKQ